MKENFLLDTHTLLWFLGGDKSLSNKSFNIIKSTSNRCFVSIASLWEIAIKINLGKLKLETDFNSFGEVLYNNDIDILQITFEHLSELMSPENIHNDPFDRILISQAKHEKIPIITKDAHIHNYSNVEAIW